MEGSDEDEGGGRETEDLTSTYEAGGDLWRGEEVTRCAGHLPIEDTGTYTSTFKTQRIEDAFCLFTVHKFISFLSVFCRKP
jgi:hypothetical protein